MANVYKIGVQLAMSSNAAQILGVLGRELLGVNTKVKDLEGGLNRVKLALVGVAAIGAGTALASSFVEPIKKAMEFERTVARFRQFGLSDKLNADIVNFAKNSKLAGTTYTDMMRNIIEAQGIFRESGLSGNEAVAGAKIMSPIMAKIKYNDTILGTNGGDIKDLLKFVEIRGGANNAAIAKKWSDIAFKLAQSSGGIVNYSSLRQFAAGVGTFGNALTQRGIVQLEPVLSDLGGGTAGSGLRVANQRLLGTQRGLPVQAISEYLKLGLWDPTKVELKKGGGIKQFLGTPGAVLKDSALLQSSPVDYFQKIFLPAIAKKYGNWILGSDQKAVTARAVEEALVFGPGTASKFFGQIDKLAPAIAKSPGAYDKQAGIDEANELAKATTAGKFADAQAKLNNLMISYGAAILPLVNKALDHLLPIMQGLATWMNNNSAAVKGVAIGVAILSGSLIAAGAVAVAIAAGPIALWVAGIGLVSSAIAGLLTYLGGWQTAINVVIFSFSAISGGFVGLINTMIGALNAILPSALRLTGVSPSKPAVPPACPKSGSPASGTLNVDGKKLGDWVWNDAFDRARKANLSGRSGYDMGYGGRPPVALGINR